MPGKRKQTKKIGTSQSRTEDYFDTILNSSEGKGLPPHKREFRFHPVRDWRFDFAFPDVWVALEIQGGTWDGGVHVRGKGYQNDCDKHNEAVALGWRVFHFTTADIMKHPVKCLKLLRRVLELA